MAWVSCTLLLYNLGKKERREMQRKFYGTKRKRRKRKKKAEEDEIPSKTTEWHSKVAWKLIGKSASECRKPQLKICAAQRARESGMERKKSLRENPWKLFCCCCGTPS